MDARDTRHELAIAGATLIDGTGRAPLSDATILISGNRITGVGRSGDVQVPQSAARIDARGKFVIPGFIDAVNSRWFNTNVENLVHYEGRYHELFIEAAQLALKGGVTGMFATWRSHQAARKARDMIRRGAVPGCRIYTGGNIIGFDGIFSADASPAAGELVSKGFAKRINDEWEKGTGRELMWLPPEEVRAIVRDYLAAQDLDYVKYAACGHWAQGGHLNAHFIAFSPRVQRVMVEEAHRAGLTIQAHTMSVESTDVAIEAGIDILTHGDISGPATSHPRATIEKIIERGVGVGVLPITQRNLAARKANRPGDFTNFLTVAQANRRNMIRAGVPLHVGTECSAMSQEEATGHDPFEDHSIEPSLHWKLGEGHFNAFLALEEEGMDRMEILKAVTSNAALAYELADVGTVEQGKLADLLILDASPLESARHYQQIHTVIHDGKVVDRGALPGAPLITTRPEPQRTLP